MAVTRVVPKAQRRFSNELERGVSATREWQVIVDDPLDDDDDVIAAVGISLLTPHPSDPISIVTQITAARTGLEWSEWRVVINYSRQSGQSQEDTQNPPTLRPVKRGARTRAIQVPVTRTINGDPIVIAGTNTPLDPPVMVTKRTPTVTFQRWQDSFSTQTQKTYCGKLNSSQFGAYGPGEVMCLDITAEELFENDGNGQLRKYWQVTYEFAQDEDGWQPRLANADYYHIDANGDRVAIYLDNDGAVVDPTDANGHPAPSPMLIYADAFSPNYKGQLATPDEIDSAISDGTFNDKFTIVPEVLQSADFNALQLPVD